MTENEILSRLCAYDERRADRVMDYCEDPPVPYPKPEKCSCDNCFYGRTEMAEELIQIRLLCLQFLNDKTQTERGLIRSIMNQLEI